jgi:hypothetical protein
MACADCHVREAAEWNESLHHTAFTDKDFQASFAVEPAQFCYDCHAPKSKVRGDAIGEARGIDCESCHLANEKHFGTRDCGGCHEFTFPHRNDLMQSTLAEHRASPFAGTKCATCHMASTNGHRDHRFSVTRNPDYLEAAMTLEATRTSTGGVSVKLTSNHVGHKFPTGDLFRRLRLVVSSGDLAHEVILERHFEKRISQQHEVSDSRIDQTRTIVFDDEWLAAPITVELRYERVAETIDMPTTEGHTSRRDILFSSLVLAETRVW